MATIVELYFVIPHLLGQNPDWSWQQIWDEIELRTGQRLSMDVRNGVEALLPGAVESQESRPR